MRAPRLALAATATALLAGTFALPSSAAAVETVDKCVASVPETDQLEAGPVQICYSLFKPAQASAAAPVPVVLHSHGWGGSRTKTAASFEKWTKAGFAVLSFDQRGFGASGGKAHVEDPAFEGKDVQKIIDEAASYAWVQKTGPKDPVLGAIGGSYGGGYQFVGAFTELMERGATRFDALAPEITWWDLRESLAPQDVVRTAWVSALYAAGAGAHTTTVHRGFVEGAATGNWPKEMQEFFKDNGPAFHVAAGRQLDIPVAFRQGASDNLFPLDQALKNFSRALTPRARTQSLLVGYNGGHALPSAVPAGYASGSDACSPKLTKGSFEDLTLLFFRKHLKGERVTVPGTGRYHLTTADGACLSVSSVTPTRTYELGQTVTTAGAGAPVSYELAAGPLKVAGTPHLDALVTSLGVDNRAFFALSVGTSPADAKVVQNNTLPLRVPGVVQGAKTRVELPSVAVEVPAGKKLFLTVSPVADMFGGHGSRTPGAVLLDGVKVAVPVQR